MAYAVEINLIQRSFSDVAHSEKAAVIALHHSKMFSQGKCNDILEQIKILENPRGCEIAGTCAQVGHKLKSRDFVASEYNLCRNTVARYLRIQHLIPGLKLKLDSGDIATQATETQKTYQRCYVFCNMWEQNIHDDSCESSSVSRTLDSVRSITSLSSANKVLSDGKYS